METIAKLERELMSMPGGPIFSRPEMRTALRRVADGAITPDDIRLESGGCYWMNLAGTMQTILWVARDPDSPQKAKALAGLIREAITEHITN